MAALVVNDLFHFSLSIKRHSDCLHLFIVESLAIFLSCRFAINQLQSTIPKKDGDWYIYA